MNTHQVGCFEGAVSYDCIVFAWGQVLMWIWPENLSLEYVATSQIDLESKVAWQLVPFLVPLMTLALLHDDCHWTANRLIVSTVGTAFHGTSRHLVKLIQPILAQNEHFLKNSTSFVTKASTWKISPDEIQVSYDVVTRYSSVSISKAVNVMIDILNIKFDMINCNSKLTISR